ncbi:thiaminase II [Pyrobaculum aerophilum]|uniref:Thiaminase II n=1 Tax=Pyrobaculum aerophilum TaxID=13773 RepID=A0A371R526_9CREN|nr:thiaminase II [Pyrobaculum aerophilum]MCX8137002.1 thiaminase II [Pyrobaculum aerophilum]RFA95595.1 thiaminase II [Pyrobaculum aerophilum]RFA99164.1 thiaminase II [Pyrobaculum aerophilum]
MVTGELRRRADEIWQRILAHPFVAELYAGTLPMDKFKYYLLQDYNYLVNFAKALSLAASRAPSVDLMKTALELAYGTVTGEMANYEALLKEVGLSLRDAAEAEPNRVNVSYMAYLKSTCALEGFYQCMAALLPCFWSYAEIAERHGGRLKENPVHVYKKWASVYLSPEYRGLVERLRAVLDSSGLSAEELWPYFKEASLYELEFWQAAYEGH